MKDDEFYRGCIDVCEMVFKNVGKSFGIDIMTLNNVLEEACKRKDKNRLIGK